MKQRARRREQQASSEDGDRTGAPAHDALDGPEWALEQQGLLGNQAIATAMRGRAAPGADIMPVTGGRPLDEDERQRHEAEIGVSLGHVSVHEGSDAPRVLGAEALQAGSHVWLDATRGRPGSQNRARVLGHELAHVAAEDRGWRDPVRPGEAAASGPSDASERGAEAGGPSGRGAAGPAQASPAMGAAPAPRAPQLPVAMAPAAAEGGAAAAGGEEEALLGDAPGPKAQISVPAPPPALPAETPPTPEPQAAPSGGGAPPPLTTAPTTRPAPAAPAGTPELPEPVLSVEQLAPADVLPVLPGPAKGCAGTGEGLGPELGAQASDLADRGAATGRALVGALLAQIDQAMAGVRGAAEQARGRIDEAVVGERARLETAAARTQASLAAVAAQEQAAVQAGFEAQRARLEGQTSVSLARADAQEAQLQADTLALGEQLAGEAIDQSETRAQQAAALASLQGGGEPPVAEGQAKAAREIAASAAERCRASGQELAEQTRADAGQLADTWGGKAEEWRAAIRQSHDEASAEIDQANAGSIGSIERVTAAMGEEAQGAADQGTAELEALQGDAIAQVDAVEAQHLAELDAMRVGIAEQVNAEVGAFQALLGGAAERVRQQLGAAGPLAEAQAETLRASFSEGVAGAAAQLEAGFSESSATVGGAVADALAGAVQRLAAIADAVVTGGGEAGAELEGRLDSSVGRAQGALSEARGEFEAKVASTLDERQAGLDAKEAEFQASTQAQLQAFQGQAAQRLQQGLAGEDRLLAEARSKVDEAGARLASRYTSLHAQAEQMSSQSGDQVHRSIWGAITSWVGGLIDSAKAWLADKFGEYWGGLVWGLLSSLAMIAVLAALIYFVPILGIPILLGGIGLCIYNRFQEYALDHPGEAVGWWAPLLVVVGIVDIIGVPLIIEGIAGKRLTQLGTDQKLGRFESGERTGQGIAFLLAALLVAARRVRGRGSEPGPQKGLEPGKEPGGEPGKGPGTDRPPRTEADIDTGRQNIHKPGTNENKTRTASPKGAATEWADPSRADALTLKAYENGQVTQAHPDGSPSEVKWAAGEVVGCNGETQITVKIKVNGQLHGFPSGPKASP